MIAVRKNKKGKRGSLMTYLSIPFLLLYLAGTVQFDSLHSLFHFEEAAVLHSAQQEENSCHNAIYHQQKDNVCHHQSHITPLKKCPLCHAVVYSSHLGSILFSHETVASTENSIGGSYANFYSGFLVLLLSRGPPPHSEFFSS